MSPSRETQSEETPLTGTEKHKNAVPGWCLYSLMVTLIVLTTVSIGAFVARSSRREHVSLASIPEPVGLPGHAWRNTNFEIEMKSRSGSINLDALLPNVRAALEAIPSVNSMARMWRIRTKSSHKELANDDVQAAGWQWENEMPASDGLLELSSPIDLNEQELEIVIMQSSFFASDFYTAGSAQVHVDARCHRQDEQRLVGLLLIWERFDSAIAMLTGHRQERPTFAATFAKRNPEILAHLQQRWEDGPSGEPLADVFNRFAKYSKWTNPRDGWRHWAVNVCHVLDVDCTHTPTEKNKVPKYGKIEFRAFDSVVGAALRLVATLAMRLVQATCDMPLDAMKPLMLLPGVSPAPDLTLLLQFLQLDPQNFYGVFGSARFLAAF